MLLTETENNSMFHKLFPGEKAIVVADNNTWKAAGEIAYESLKSAGVNLLEPYIFKDEHFYAEWSFLERIEAVLRESGAVAVAVGSGVINDLVKTLQKLMK